MKINNKAEFNKQNVFGLGQENTARDFLIRVVSQCLPYIGYPRSLNAVACVNKAAES